MTDRAGHIIRLILAVLIMGGGTALIVAQAMQSCGLMK